ncbi:MAG TPA: hypothetical protein DCL41_06200 [Bdellovibrionales bacterium]|mgnify:CR=1 FL=1|nr:hypothetical protein [Pseudobdellovibrionaceae bacterium]HAG91441.1 hypothetical protein [Bdellovibrionales bacterium]|tara:strand:+ start:159 stop:1007 length:849 start_codon:yes stop_codon:yes gene_type:complete
MNKRILILLILMGTAGCFEADQNDLGLKPQAVTKRDLYQRISMSGTVQTAKQQMVLAPYDGNIKKIYVEIGQKVIVNQPLVSIESNASLGSNYPLRSNFPGTVTQISVREGEFVRGKDQSTILVRLDDLSQLFIRAKVSEADYPKLKLGQKADISVQALPSLRLKGEVTQISLAPDGDGSNSWRRGNDSVEYPVELKIIEAPSELRPGMSAIVDAITGEKKDALSIPHEYVQRKGRGFTVETTKGDSIEVKMGLQTDQYLEVLNIPEGTMIKPVDFYGDLKQ